MAKVICRINAQGNVSFEVDGVKGTGCENLTRAFIEAIGTPTKIETKDEYYDQIDDVEATLFESNGEE